MSDSSQQPSDVAEALHDLSKTIVSLQAGYAKIERTNRLLRLGLIGVLLLLVVGLYVGIQQAISPMSHVLAQIANRLNVSTDPEADELHRQQLIEGLTPEQRVHVERFEQQHKWIADYIQANPEFNAGAAIAVFLSDMTNSVRVMPDMLTEIREMKREVKVMSAEVQTMDDQMKSIPVISAELQTMNQMMQVLTNDVHGMHLQMYQMSEDIDSTMGEAGRMMPWQW